MCILSASCNKAFVAATRFPLLAANNLGMRKNKGIIVLRILARFGCACNGFPELFLPLDMIIQVTKNE